MTITIHFLLSLSMLLVAGNALSFAADAINCPKTIATRQQLSAPETGWSATLDDTPQTFSGITFYDGPPTEKASLVYDQIKHAKGEDVASWNFGQVKDRQTYVTCNYAGTVVQLARKLPPQITSCTVTYDTQQHISGQPVIKKIDCH
jgi:hypothetical protein